MQIYIYENTERKAITLATLHIGA